MASPRVTGTRWDLEHELITEAQSLEEDALSILLRSKRARTAFEGAPEGKTRIWRHRAIRAAAKVFPDPEALKLLSRADELFWQVALKWRELAYKVSSRAPDETRLEDRAQEVLIALYEAAVRFEPARGLAFSTYAGNWALQKSMRDDQCHRDVVRRPAHVHALRTRLDSCRIELETSGDEARPELLAALLGVSHDRVRLALGIRASSSLDAPAFAEGEPKVVLLPTAPSVFGGSEFEEWACDFSRVEGLLEETLTRREMRAVRLRFGLDEGASPCTLDGVGRDLQVTREGARKLVARAIGKLRSALDLEGDEGLRDTMLA